MNDDEDPVFEPADDSSVPVHFLIAAGFCILIAIFLLLWVQFLSVDQKLHNRSQVGKRAVDTIVRSGWNSYNGLPVALKKQGYGLIVMRSGS